MNANILTGAMIGMAVGLLLGLLTKKRTIKTSPLAGPAAILMICTVLGAVIGQRFGSPVEAAHVEEVGGRFEEAVLKSPRPVLVDFYATWCPPCRRLAPTIAELAREYAGRADVVKVDGDQSPDVVRQYKIQGYPTVVLFVGGEPKRYLPGARDAEEYRAVLDEALRMQPATAGSRPSLNEEKETLR